MTHPFHTQPAHPRLLCYLEMETATLFFKHAFRLTSYKLLNDLLTVDAVPTTYTLNLTTGLTQVLTDGDTTYLCGLARLVQGLDLMAGNLAIRTVALSLDGSVLYAGTIGQGLYRLGTPVTTEP
jgi:hypothetical protein